MPERMVKGIGRKDPKIEKPVRTDGRNTGGIMRLPLMARSAAMVLLGCIVMSANAGPAAKSIKWYTEYNKAAKLAASEKKIMMVDFFTEH